MTFSVGIFSFSFLNMYLTAQQDWTQKYNSESQNFSKTGCKVG